MDYNIINPAMNSIQEVYATLLTLSHIGAIDGFNYELKLTGIIDIRIYEDDWNKRVDFRLEPNDIDGAIYKQLIDYLHILYDSVKERVEQKISLLNNELSMYNFLEQKYNG